MGFNSGFKGLISFIKQSHYRPGQAMRVPGGCGSHILRQSAHEGSKVVSPKHRPPLPPQEIFLVLISVRSWVDPRAVSAAGRITSMKNSSDTIGKQTRDLPACSAVPQPTAPPRAPKEQYFTSSFSQNSQKNSTFMFCNTYRNTLAF